MALRPIKKINDDRIRPKCDLNLEKLARNFHLKKLLEEGRGLFEGLMKKFPFDPNTRDRKSN